MPSASKILERTWNRLKAHYSESAPLGAWSRAYRRILGSTYRFLIPRGCRVLEIGCGSGDLLQHLPDRPLAGIDLVDAQVSAAKKRLPQGQFTCAAGETATFDQTYDYLILSDTLNEAADAQQLLENLHHAATPETRLVLNIHNTLWRPLLGVGALCLPATWAAASRQWKAGFTGCILLTMGITYSNLWGARNTDT